MKTQGPSAIAMLCDDEGAFTVIRDDLGLCCHSTSLYKLVDSGSAEKARNFLKAITDESAAFGWEMNVLLKETPTPFQFAGSRAGEKSLIIGGATRSDVTQLSEELMAMNSEQTAALRNALKDLSLFQRDKVERDARMFDELSRLNNELVTLQRELARKNHELEKLNNLKNTFLGMASHDLRKPLSVVQMNADLLLSNSVGTLNPDQASLAAGVKETCQKVIRELNDFLDIAQIESGRLKLNLTECDLGRLVSSRLAIHRKQAEAKAIKIEFSADQDLPESQLDPDRAGQVADNLIENAIKYSPGGSTVRVRVKQSIPGVTLEVEDEGPGLTPEQMNRLFEAFQSVGSKSTGGERSSGLGLAIVKAIMAEHRGKVSIESHSGKGARFVAFFP